MSVLYRPCRISITKLLLHSTGMLYLILVAMFCVCNMHQQRQIKTTVLGQQPTWTPTVFDALVFLTKQRVAVCVQ